MVMPLRCSAVSSSAALEGKLNRDGKGGEGTARSVLSHCVSVPLPRCNTNIGKRARGQCTPSVGQHMALIGPHEQGLGRPLLTPHILPTASCLSCVSLVLRERE